MVPSALTSSKDECVNMSSWPMVMRGVMTEVGGVMGVMAGDGPSDSSTSLSGLSSETSSVASVGRKPGSTVIMIPQPGQPVWSYLLTGKQVVCVVIKQQRLFGPIGLGGGDSGRNVGLVGLRGRHDNNKTSNNSR